MVFLVDWDKMQKVSVSMLVLGILCVAVAGPVLSYGLSTWPVVPQSTQTIQDASMTNSTLAYAYPFTITYDEQISAKISCTYENCSVNVKILARGAFDAAFKTGANPTGITGLTFQRSQPNPGSGVTYSWDTSYAVPSEGIFAFVDFAGNSGGNSPGSYVLIVYGDNSGTDTDVKFDIQITQEIFGRIWGRFVTTIGWGLIIVCGIIAVALFVKKTMEGRS